MFLGMFIFSAISLASIGLIWVVQEYDQFMNESDKLKNEYIKRQKQLIRTEVLRAVDLIDFNIKQTEIRLKESIKNRVYESHQIAMNLYDQFHKSRNESEIKRLIIEALRNVRFNNGRGYYFITDFSGVEQLFADHPELEGRDLSNMQDLQGKFVIKDMIRIANTSGEGFYRYHWTKPDAIGNQHIKIVFVKHFEPFNWIIGTGEYLDDVKKEVQNKVLKRLTKLRFGTNGYIFGSTYKGEPLFTNGKITKGTKSLWDLTDPDGIKIIQEQRKAVRNIDGDFYRYSWTKLNFADPSPKLSFSKGIPEWEWMIGTGVYMDDIHKTITLRRGILNKKVAGQFIKVTFVFIILSLIAYIIAKYISAKILKTHDRFLVFFDKASTNYVQIDPSGMIFHEFASLAELTNRLIEDREKSKQALSKSEAGWRSLTETSPDHIFTLGTELNIQFANFAAPGLTVKELIGTPLYQYVEGAEKQAEVKALLESVLQTGEIKTYDTIYDSPNGETIYYESRVVPRKLEGSKETIGLTVNSRNFSERKLMEKALQESEEKYRSLSNGLPALVCEFLPDSTLTFVNRAYYEYFGKTAEELVGRPFLDLIPEEIRQVVKEDYMSTTLWEPTKPNTHEVIIQDEVRWLEWTNSAIFDKDGQIERYRAIGIDITKRKKTEEEIIASLKEKETLLHEIHHRVKNNMAVISSLLKLQSNALEDSRMKEILKESQSRVYVMSAVHETLHGSEKLSEINLKTYLSKISTFIFQAYNTKRGNVKLSCKIEDEPISINQAYPLGLVINELISNSLKYAFPEDRTGEITVGMEKLDKELELTIMDDGIGTPEGFDWKNANSLGLKLVRTLVENQLDGSIDMESKNGTKFIIKFNV